MPSGRPRKPSNILELSGAFKHNPNRARPNEPKPEGTLNLRAPVHMTQGMKKCWKEIVKVAPAGVLTSADGPLVEMACALLAEFRSDPMDMPIARMARLHALLRSMGMDPSGRASLVVPNQKTNPFEATQR